jgi:predicted dienelactone hydrolase
MNLTAATLATLILTTMPALSAGFERVTVTDRDGPPLEAGIWYPSEASASPQPLGLYQQNVATDAAVAGHGLPLIVMSHGSGGSFEGHYDTALALAAAGFVVAAVTHTGDNYRDHSGFAQIEKDRPRHIKALVDYMLVSWPHRDLIDPARIGMFGFSAGGFTVLVLIGGEPDMTLGPAYCARYPDEWACRKIGEYGSARAAPNALVHDRRISAAVIAAPAVGYAFTPEALAGIKAPIQLWRGDSDEILPHPRHAQHVYDGLPSKPEYHVVPNAGHFAFLAPCTAMAEKFAPEICRDPAGFDRAAFHQQFNSAVVAFLKAKLPARP